MDAIAAEAEVSFQIFGIWSILLLLLSIALYIVTSYFMMKTADRLGVENSWFAFIPFLNLWLICDMGKKEVNWFIIILIFSFCCPIVSIVMITMIMMDVSAMLGFENWWGILLLIPIFNIYVLYKFAFTDPY